MIIYIIAIGALLLCVFIVWFGRKPMSHHVHASDFSGFVRCLLSETSHGSILVFRHRPSKCFVQFVKYVDAGNVYLHYGFPRAQWSAARFEAVKTALEQEKTGVKLTTTDDPHVSTFIEIDWINPKADDMDEAAMVATKTFSALGIRANEDFLATIEGSRDANVMISEMKRFSGKLEQEGRGKTMIGRMVKKSIEGLENKAG